jgi:regulator of PEP synthase PpsR (kinase-PPPase family)
MMLMAQPNAQYGVPPPIYIVSGGAGTSGEQLVDTVLVQFPDNHIQVIKRPHVRRIEQVEEIISQAAAAGGIIVHTMVDPDLRTGLVRLAHEQRVVAIDLMGDLLSHLTNLLDREPVGYAGLYRQLHQGYFKRVEAIEFTMAHDDGKNSEGWPQADMVLLGVSRAGKTPLSMYLSVQGWKVANVPLVPQIPTPPELFQLDRRRVIGLDIEAGQLVVHRKQRQRQLHAPGPTTYTDPSTIFEEIEAARRVFRKGRFAVIDVTDKPIETSADEVVERVTRQLRAPSGE